MCPECWRELAFVAAPVCRVCGFGLQAEGAGEGPDGDTCGACMVSPPRFDRARAMLAYDDASRPIIIAYKRASRLEATPLLTRWLLAAGRDLLADADVLAPTPLHWRRLLGRRYNQSAELARRMAGSEDYSLCARFAPPHPSDAQPGRAQPRWPQAQFDRRIQAERTLAGPDYRQARSADRRRVYNRGHRRTLLRRAEARRGACCRRRHDCPG